MLKADGVKIRRLRKRSKMNIDDFARACGASRSQLHEIEAGTANPTLRTLNKIAAALNVKRPKDLIMIVSETK